MNTLMLTASAASVEPQVSAGAALVRTAGSLVVVLLIIVALAWLARRLPVNRGQGTAMKLESGLRLGTRERLLIVEVEGRRLLLGVAPGHVGLLTELEEHDDAGDAFDTALNDVMSSGKPEAGR